MALPLFLLSRCYPRLIITDSDSDSACFLSSQAWLWQQVDVIMPELYIPTTATADFTRGMLREAERLVSVARAAGNTKLGIVPFTWMRFDNDNKRFLDVERLAAEFEVPFEFPHVEAVLVWGDPVSDCAMTV